MVDLTPQRHTDGAGNVFEYVHIQHPGSNGLIVHFSAFFGKWGDAKPYRDRFQGYFHRLKMLGLAPQHDWLFLCDSYGAFDNGTYYTGEAGDLYVERGMEAILEQHVAEPASTVMMGSSMGATAALKFGNRLDVAGIAAITPHIDLDTSAARQDRMEEVAWICPDGDALAEHNRVFTRQVRNELAERPGDRPLPRLFIQSCSDDAGVHEEQVVPLVESWRRSGGSVDLDERSKGGHTSDFATRSTLLDVAEGFVEGRPLDLEKYRNHPDYCGTLTTPPLSNRVRRQASLLRKRVLAHRS